MQVPNLRKQASLGLLGTHGSAFSVPCWGVGAARRSVCGGCSRAGAVPEVSSSAGAAFARPCRDGPAQGLWNQNGRGQSHEMDPACGASVFKVFHYCSRETDLGSGGHCRSPSQKQF